MTEKSTSNSPLNLVGTVLGAAGGWIFSEYCGLSIWIPGAACILFLVLFAKTSLKPKYFAGAIATTSAHVAWFLIASILYNLWLAVGLDIVFLGIGVVWLWTRPGFGSALYLGIVQFLSTVFGAIVFYGAPFGSTEHRALTAHLIFRILSLICLGVGYRHLKKNPPNQAPLPTPVSVTPAAGAPVAPDTGAAEL